MNDRLKDLFNDNKVTTSVQQPPSGVNVTEIQSKDPTANTLNQAEAQQQGMMQAVAASIEVDPNYIFTVERAAHKVTIKPTIGQVYNYLAECTCAWQGRFLTNNEAEIKAKQHLFILPRRGM